MGVPYTLASAQPTGWRIDFYVIAALDATEPGPLSYYRADAPHRLWVDVGRFKPGVDTVRIPTVAHPGTYRQCTANAAHQACTSLTAL